MHDDVGDRPETAFSPWGIGVGLLLFSVMVTLPPPEGLPSAGWKVAACAALMAIWWVSEAIPIAATALVPLVLFPLLGVRTIDEAAAPYANPVIFLFLGGFVIAKALEECGLHRRMALAILTTVGAKRTHVVGGFMLATAFLSMWVSNTATVVMMLPMALSVIALAEKNESADPNLAIAVLLGIAYAANIGGLGTLIGTPPNALLAGFMSESYGVEIGFGEWMVLGVPLVAVALPVAWLILVRWLHPLRPGDIAGGMEMIGRERRALGSLSSAELVVGAITTLVATAWIIRPLIETRVPGLSDAGIAIAGSLLLFIVPVSLREPRPPLRWSTAETLPWAVLILFGGGLSLAAAIQATGLAGWIGDAMSGAGALPPILLIALVTTVVVFMTELTSNTATAAALLPVVASVAVGMGLDPMQLAVPTAIAASCAFMMPVATPPNAIVYGSGRMTIRQMALAGFWINLVMIVLIVAAVRIWLR